MNAAVEIDIPVKPQYILSYLPGIWIYPLFGYQTIFFGMTECSFDGIAMQNVSVVKAMWNGIDEMIAVESIEIVINTPNSFWFGDVSGTKSVVFNLGKSGVGRRHWIGKKIEIGIIEGYIASVDRTRPDLSFYNGSYYAPRVNKIPNLTQKRDNLFYGVIQFQEGTIELENSDGVLDEKQFCGSLVRVYAFDDGDEQDSWALAFSGIISKQNISESSLSITYTDKRAIDDRQIIAGKINRDTCPTVFAPEDTEELIVPVTYNMAIKAPAVPISDTGTSVTFKFCAGMGDEIGGSIDQIRKIAHFPYFLPDSAGGIGGTGLCVYCETDDSEEYMVFQSDGFWTRSKESRHTGGVFTAVSGLLTVDIQRGTFTIHGDYAMSGESYQTFYVDHFGWHRYSSASEYWDGLPWLNGAEIAFDILNQFSFVQYNEANFNLQTYETEKKKAEEQRRKVSISITDDVKARDIIGKIMFSIDAIFPVLSDGRYGMRIDTHEAAPVAEIKLWQRFKEITSSVDLKEIVTSVDLIYGPAGNEENKLHYIDRSQEKTLSDRWKTTNQYSAETLLYNEEAVKKKTDSILSDSMTPRSGGQWQGKATKALFALDIIDALIAPKNRSGSRSVFDITSISKDILGDSITITGRHRYDLEYDLYPGIIARSVYPWR